MAKKRKAKIDKDSKKKEKGQMPKKGASVKKSTAKSRKADFAAKPERGEKFSGRIFGALNPYLEIGLLALVIAAFAFILYYDNTENSIVYCDDNIFIERITQDQDIAGTLDTTLGTTFYRPVLTASFIIDAREATLDGVDDINQLKVPPNEKKLLENLVQPAVYHRTNLILHILGSILVFIALIKLRFPIILSLIMSLIFTAHPILTPAVAWISGRNDSMITVFVLASFIFFINFIEEKNFRREAIFLIFHLLFFTLSLFTKEMGAFFPFLCLLYIPFLMYFKQDKRRITTKTLILLPSWFALGMAWMLMRRAALEKIKSPDEIGFSAFIENFNTFPAMIGKIFIPYKMIALSSFEAFSIISGWIFIIAIVATYYYVTKKSGGGMINKGNYKLFWGLAWFVLLLFPTLFIRIQYVGDFFDYAEHRAYLPMFGILVFVCRFLVFKKINFKKPIPLAIAGAIILLFAWKAFDYKSSFENRFTFWEKMTEMYPHKARGYYDLGLAYRSIGDTSKAISLYKETLERNSKNRKAYVELMKIYSLQGDAEKMQEAALGLLQIEPGHPQGNFYYGKSLYLQGRPDEAIPYFDAALKRERRIPEWFITLAKVFLETGQYKKSLGILEQFVQKGLNFPDAFVYMGMNYYHLGQAGKAQEAWQNAMNLNLNTYIPILAFFNKTNQYKATIELTNKAEEIRKELPHQHFYLKAQAYLNLDSLQKAEQAALAGIEKYPGNKAMLEIIGDIYAQQQALEKGINFFRESIKADSNNSYPYYFLGMANYKLKNYEKALDFLKKCNEINSSYRNTLDLIGICYYYLEDFTNAEKWWKEAIEKAPGELNAYYNLMRLYKKQGRTVELNKYAAAVKENGGEIPNDLKVN